MKLQKGKWYVCIDARSDDVGLPVGRLGRLVARGVGVGRRMHAGRHLAPFERRLTCRREKRK